MKARWRRRCAVAGLSLSGLLVSGAASGQLIVGTVSDSARVPIQAALVTALDVSGVVQGRALTDPDGRYRIRLSAGTPVQLVVERIGFATYATEFGSTDAEGPQIRNIVLSTEAVPLTGLVVQVPPRFCDRSGDAGPQLVRAWEEATKALRTVAMTQERSPLSFRVERYRRRLAEDGEEVLEHQRDRHWLRTLTPFRSPPIDSLMAEGFLVEREGELIYRGPDVTTLLSGAFADTHCLTVAPSEDSTVAVAFRPVPGRSMPGIAGQLILRTVDWRLQQVRFHYVNASEILGDARATGEVSFAELPDGRWLVRRWQIRMPLLERRIRPDLWDEGVHVIGYVEEGGLVRETRGASGDVLFRASTGHIAATVVDSTGNYPIQGAVVRVPGAGATATTDAHGRFVIGDLMAGTYLVRVRTPLLDSLGLGSLEERITVVAGDTRNARLREPRVEELVLDRCSKRDAGPDGRTVLHLALRDRSGNRLAAGQPVRLEWDRFSMPGSGREVVRSTNETLLETDSLGTVRACDVPDYVTYRITANPGTPEEASGSLWVPSGAHARAAVIDLRGEPAATASGREPRQSPAPVARGVVGEEGIYRVDGKELEALAEGTRDIAGLIRSIPGLRARRNSGGLCVTTTRVTTGYSPRRGEIVYSHSEECPGMIPVYVDDVRLGPDQAGRVLESFSGGSIGSIEYVSGWQAGARYGTGAANGVLLIRTR